MFKLLSRPKTAAGEKGDQREWYRYAGASDAACRIIVGPTIDFWAVRIQNVSGAGITLVTDRALVIGSEVVVELQRPARQVQCRRCMQIIYQFKEPSGDFILGGAFTKPLPDPELVAFAANRTPLD
jgi:hypothetical protein